MPSPRCVPAYSWMPLIFAGMVFVTGLAMWLAAKPQPNWNVDAGGGATTRSRSVPAPMQNPERALSFLPDEDEPVRLGVNMG